MSQLLSDSPLPLYYQLKEILKDKIKAGDLEKGDKLPSERELEEDYGVSRMTARRALKELCNEGYVYRQQGRGTFVSDRKYRYHLFRLTSFTEESESQDLKPGAKVLEVELIEDDLICKKMGIEPEPLISIKRVRTINQEPVALEIAYIRSTYCSGLEKVDLNDKSLYSYINSEYNIRLGKAEQNIEARLIPIELAGDLGVDEGIPVLFVEQVTFLEDKEIPLEYSEAFYRGDRYKLTVKMKR